jgi:hypothetical protein
MNELIDKKDHRHRQRHHYQRHHRHRLQQLAHLR